MFVYHLFFPNVGCNMQISKSYSSSGWDRKFAQKYCKTVSFPFAPSLIYMLYSMVVNHTTRNDLCDLEYHLFLRASLFQIHLFFYLEMKLETSRDFSFDLFFSFFFLESLFLKIKALDSHVTKFNNLLLTNFSILTRTRKSFA